MPRRVKAKCRMDWRHLRYYAFAQWPLNVDEEDQDTIQTKTYKSKGSAKRRLNRLCEINNLKPVWVDE